MGEIELTDQVQAVKCFAAKKTYKKNNCVKNSEKKRKLECQEFTSEDLQNEKNNYVGNTDGEKYGKDENASDTCHGIVNLNQVNRILLLLMSTLSIN